MPAIEFPAVPRLFSFMAAPATLPPTAPLTNSTIRLVMSIWIYFYGLLYRAGPGKRSSENASKIASASPANGKFLPNDSASPEEEHDFSPVSPAGQRRHLATSVRIGAIV